nr:MAG TPA: hypothetical protein [Caudoviricetes sp.]
MQQRTPYQILRCFLRQENKAAVTRYLQRLHFLTGLKRHCLTLPVDNNCNTRPHVYSGL